jgi:hypothetical protein
VCGMGKGQPTVLKAAQAGDVALLMQLLKDGANVVGPKAPSPPLSPLVPSFLVMLRVPFTSIERGAASRDAVLGTGK